MFYLGWLKTKYNKDMQTNLQYYLYKYTYIKKIINQTFISFLYICSLLLSWPRSGHKSKLVYVLALERNPITPHPVGRPVISVGLPKSTVVNTLPPCPKVTSSYTAWMARLCVYRSWVESQDANHFKLRLESAVKVAMKGSMEKPYHQIMRKIRQTPSDSTGPP